MLKISKAGWDNDTLIYEQYINRIKYHELKEILGKYNDLDFHSTEKLDEFLKEFPCHPLAHIHLSLQKNKNLSKLYDSLLIKLIYEFL